MLESYSVSPFSYHYSIACSLSSGHLTLEHFFPESFGKVLVTGMEAPIGDVEMNYDGAEESFWCEFPVECSCLRPCPWRVSQWCAGHGFLTEEIPPQPCYQAAADGWQARGLVSYSSPSLPLLPSLHPWALKCFSVLSGGTTVLKTATKLYNSLSPIDFF